MTAVKVKTNLRCGACVQSITPLLDAELGAARWSADVSTPDKVLTVEGDGVTAARVDELLRRKGYAVVGEIPTAAPPSPPAAPEPATSYFPLLLILLYLAGATAVFELSAGAFNGMRAMRHFMAGFFLVFSFFKLLNLTAFADAYAGYDLIARRSRGYALAYPFVELALGLAYLGGVWPVLTNIATVLVMGVGTAGVVTALLSRRKIRCACLGAVFNLPMSTVTLVEDLLMVGMAAWMLALM